MIQAESILANSQRPALKVSKALEESLADKDLEALLVLKALEDTLELQALQVQLALKVSVVLRATKAIQDLLEKTEQYHSMN